MIERIDLEPGFVLHARPWRETSQLLDVFTPTHGLLGLVARGARRPKSILRAILQPFQPLCVSWSGRGGGLMTLRAAEAGSPALTLCGTALMSGFYVNELLLRFLHRGDPHPRLFDVYDHSLRVLAQGVAPEVALRGFELELLSEAGYGLILDHDAISGDALDPAGAYRYEVERGPLPLDRAGESGLAFTGAQLLAIGRGDFGEPGVMPAARRLLRAALDHHLGGRPLRTREVFGAMRA